ncbi:hypothetical protein [Winogradskya humida]|uniref:DUF1963 domain-containing protein n=1 Tax=Winogradskya humida TaxID=113566 RepID=A0ABQ3ZTU7_9ACTN|nr:hypothetical protein [Actinoplanes humidus]GIE21973.1 hypothetical protein Ahu01nite_050750 [Actinoplanes humidus]
MLPTIPALEPYARTTVRLNPRPGHPVADQSSMGGPLLWPADEPWPACDGPLGEDHYDNSPGEAEAPLVPVLQLLAGDVPELPFPDGTDVLQVLWCPFDHDPFSSPRPEVRWRRSADVGPRLLSIPAPDQESSPEFVPSPCVLSPERVTEYPTFDLPRDVWLQIRDEIEQVKQDTGWEYESELAVAPGTKAGGYPGWTQSPDWPDCSCGAPMEHLLTVTGWEFDRDDNKRWTNGRPESEQNPAGLMLGDAGGIYLFVCTRCDDRPVDYRFDCS